MVEGHRVKRIRVGPLAVAVLIEVVCVISFCRYQAAHDILYRIEITPSQLTIPATAPVHLKVKLVNLSAHQFEFEGFEIDGSDVLNPSDVFDIQLKTLRGIALKTKSTKKAPPIIETASWQYMSIDPGEKYEEVITLSSVYDLVPNTYHIEASLAFEPRMSGVGFLVGPLHGNPGNATINVHP